MIKKNKRQLYVWEAGCCSQTTDIFLEKESGPKNSHGRSWEWYDSPKGPWGSFSKWVVRMAFLLFSYQTVPQHTKKMKKVEFHNRVKGLEGQIETKKLNQYKLWHIQYIYLIESRQLVLKISYDQKHLC